MILLQTIPDSVDIESLRNQLLKQFPGIVNIHDFHVWELTANKVISTVHIIFQNPKVNATGLSKCVRKRKAQFAETFSLTSRIASSCSLLLFTRFVLTEDTPGPL